jgi:cytochrome P450
VEEAPRLPIARVTPFDPPQELGRLRDEAPISRLTYPDGHVGWLVTNHALARAVLADPRVSARQDLRHLPMRNLSSRSRRSAAPGMFNRMDPPDHTRYRRLLNRQFTTRRLRQLEPRVRQIVDEHLQAMECAGSPADLVRAFAMPIPLLVICELLGVPYADRERFLSHTATMLNLRTSEEQAVRAFVALGKYLRELVTAKPAEPADDLLSGLAETSDLTNQELGNIAIVLLIAGHETTANMLALGTFALLQHPDQLDALQADPSLIDGTVEELLRYLSIIHIGPFRAALEDIELGGHVIKAGDAITVSTTAANRDPAQYDDPDTLNIHRAATGHLSFGHGVHQCLGQQLARAEMRIAFPALFDRFPTLRLAVPPEEIPLRDDMSIYGVHALPVAW